MTLVDWLIAVVDGAAASVLLCAGSAKLIAPRHLEQALAEAVPAVARNVRPGAVRCLAATELVVAAALLVTPTRMSAAIAAAALGVCFSVFGRKPSTPSTKA